MVISLYLECVVVALVQNRESNMHHNNHKKIVA